VDASGTSNPPPRIRVLIAEDEALVSMLIEAELADAGFVVVGPFATCAETRGWLETDTPDVAVLDHGLRDGPCTDAAEILVSRGVPFVALSGTDRDEIPPVMRAAPFLEKPSDLSRLPRLLSDLIGRGNSGASG
jgi:AmiR/NasT family two-component response regulator